MACVLWRTQLCLWRTTFFAGGSLEPSSRAQEWLGGMQ